MEGKNFGRHRHVDPDFDMFIEGNPSLLSRVRDEAYAEMSRTLAYAKEFPADPREAFTFLGRLAFASVKTIDAKMNAQWNPIFDIKNKEVCSMFAVTSVQDCLKKGGNVK